MPAAGEEVIGPDEDQSRDAQPDHEELAAGAGLVAGRFVWIRRLVAGNGF